MSKIPKEPSPITPRKPLETEPSQATGELPAAPRTGNQTSFDLSLEKKKDIVCPVLSAFVAQGLIKLDPDGSMSITDLNHLLVTQMKMSKPLAAITAGTGVAGNRPADILGNILGMQFNPLLLRGGMIKHPADSAILTNGKFDPQKFEALASHAAEGQMTIGTFSHYIKANFQRDRGVDAALRGVPSSIVEFSALINVFGKRDAKTGERTIGIETLRNFYEHKQLPPAEVMTSRPTTGMPDLIGTMAQMAWGIPFGSAPGIANKGIRDVNGEPPANGPAADAATGARKAMCPYAGNAGALMQPHSLEELAAKHDPSNRSSA